MKFAFSTDWHLTSVNPSSRIDDYTEAAFKKIEWVLKRCKEENAVLLLGGDLFSTPSQIDSIKNRLKSMILDHGIMVVSIPGNHDLLHYNTDYIDRTSYQSMIAPSVMVDLQMMPGSRIEIGGWEIVAHKFAEAFPEIVIENTIVLSHSFFNYDRDEKLAVQKQKVYQSKAKYVCFGHDHNQYPVEDSNGTVVVRPGALLRGTSHTENRVRQISIAWIDTVKGTALYEPVPFVHKFEDVFKTNFDITHEKKVTTFEEIQKFIDGLRNAKVSVNPYDILMNMEVTQEVRRRCNGYLEKVGLVK
jgi:DNA repair exonuclease SbcCD nuclease subunit